MSETIYHDKDGGTPPAGTPPSDVDGDVARVADALEEEKGHDLEKSYGRVEHDFVGRAGDPGRMDQGRSTGRTHGAGIQI
jgi:hypothetical protein